MCVCSVKSYSWQPHGLYPTRLLCLWNSPGKKTGVGCHFLLQGIFPTQGWNPHLLRLLHWQVDSLPPSLLESPTRCLYHPPSCDNQNVSTHCQTCRFDKISPQVKTTVNNNDNLRGFYVQHCCRKGTPKS